MRKKLNLIQLVFDESDGIVKSIEGKIPKEVIQISGLSNLVSFNQLNECDFYVGDPIVPKIANAYMLGNTSGDCEGYTPLVFYKIRL